MKDIQKIKEFFSKPLEEVKEETAVDMAKRQLDALGVKYELGNKFKPFKTIYKPTGKSDKFYDTFNDIIDLFSLGNAVESSMNEANGFKSGKEFINIKLQKYPKAVAKINQLISMVGESNFTMEMAEWLFDFFNNASYESSVNEAKEEDKVDTITMDVPLFLRMLEYSREDASQDMDLHDITEKAISLGKERGILQMDDYEEIISATEEINEQKVDMAELEYTLKRVKKENPGKKVGYIFVKDAPKGYKISINGKYTTESLVTEKAISLGKERGILQMDDYEEIVDATEEINEAKGSLKVEKQKDGKYYWTFTFESGKTEKSFDGFNTSAEAQKDFMYRSKFLKEDMNAPKWNSMSKEDRSKVLKKYFPKLSDKFSDYKWSDLTGMIIDKLVKESELTEAYVPSNIKEFAKRKGVSSLVNKVAGWAEKVGKGIRGGTAIGKNYSTLVLDMDYQTGDIRINTDDNTITLYDEPADSFDEFKQVYLDNQDIEENVAPNHDGKAAPYGSGYKPLEERIAKALNQINEELCPAGKAYRKRRMAAGEKSSAYLSGRAVKVCKGQMSGKKKK